MGWFDEQIRQRKAEDDKIFRESLKDAATTILGSRQSYMGDDHALTANALEKILRFYHLKRRKRSILWREGSIMRFLLRE